MSVEVLVERSIAASQPLDKQHHRIEPRRRIQLEIGIELSHSLDEQHSIRNRYALDIRVVDAELVTDALENQALVRDVEPAHLQHLKRSGHSHSARRSTQLAPDSSLDAQVSNLSGSQDHGRDDLRKLRLLEYHP